MALKNKLSKLLSGVVVLPLVLASANAHAKSVYVSAKGQENGTGTMTSPYKTIGKAMKSDLKPGDEVIVKEGRYSENVVVSKDGTESAYITLRSEVPGGAVIDVPDTGQLGINVAANYVIVEGFEVTGSAKSGIGGRRVHHVKILNNESHHNKTGGIAFQESEFLTVEGNLVHGNANYSVISGISILHAQNITGDKSDKGFRIIVRGNTSHSTCTLANNQASLPTAVNGNKLGVNPRFINAPENFHLQSDSPAIDSGSSSFGVGPYDFDGGARVVRTIDIGAHEAGN